MPGDCHHPHLTWHLAGHAAGAKNAAVEGSVVVMLSEKWTTKLGRTVGRYSGNVVQYRYSNEAYIRIISILDCRDHDSPWAF